ncbi:MAG: type II toxin-antitoxin system PemK/MazF family toxin [Candidatus Latescibacterota bacterium]
MVNAGSWRPEQADIIWMTFDPVKGHEQSGRRPALVLSHGDYNEHTGLVLVCPITSIRKGFSFEIPLPVGLGVHGVILSDHIKCFDWRARNAEYIVSAPQSVVDEVIDNIDLLIK